jgi:hypothetical protein
MKGFKNQMSKYKLIQLTNTNIGALDANEFVPLGTITRKINAPAGESSAFEVATTGANIVYLNDPGYYKITYTGTLTAAAAGTLGITLVANNNAIITASEEATAAEDVVNITLIYVIRVCPNSCATPFNCPTSIQIQLGDVALGATPASSIGNLVIERVF